MMVAISFKLFKILLLRFKANKTPNRIDLMFFQKHILNHQLSSDSTYSQIYNHFLCNQYILVFQSDVACSKRNILGRLCFVDLKIANSFISHVNFVFKKFFNFSIKKNLPSDFDMLIAMIIQIAKTISNLIFLYQLIFIKFIKFQINF